MLQETKIGEWSLQNDVHPLVFCNDSCMILEIKIQSKRPCIYIEKYFFIMVRCSEERLRILHISTKSYFP